MLQSTEFGLYIRQPAPRKGVLVIKFSGIIFSRTSLSVTCIIRICLIFMGKIEKISLRIFLAVVLLVPVIFIPTYGELNDMSKTVLIALGFSVCLGLLGLAFFRQKQTPIPRGLVTWSAIGIIVSMAVSTVLSPSFTRSLIAQGFETTSLMFVLLMFVVMFVATVTISSKQRVIGFLGAFLGGYSIIALLQIVRLFVSEQAFTLGVFTVKSSTLLGSWYDLALWSVLAVITSAYLINYKALNPTITKLIYIVYVVGVVFLVAINSFSAWCAVIAVAVLHIVFLVKEKALASDFKKASFWIILLPAIFGVVFFVSNKNLSPKVYNIIGVSPAAIQFNRVALSLPLKETVAIATDIIADKPFFGTKPMRFQYEYFKYKPSSINSSNAWAIEFSSGYGYILTSIIEQGILGIIFWVLFLGGIITLAVKALSAKVDDRFIKFSLSTSAFASIASIVILATFMPTQATMTIIFLSFGWLVASVHMVQKFSLKPASTVVRNKILAGLIMLLAIFIILIYGRKVLATLYFTKGAKAISRPNPDFTVVHQAFAKAAAIEPLDLNYQALAQAALYTANDQLVRLSTLTQGDQSKLSDQDRQAAQDLVQSVQTNITDSINSAKAAVMADPESHYNYVTEARISTALVSIQVQNAKENAVRAYNDAITLNHNSPELLLERAQFSFDLGDLAGAKEFIGKALAIKPDLIEAVFLLTQVQIKEGSLDDAIVSADQALRLNPSLPILHFQMGLLRYFSKEYTKALEVFKNALSLEPNYSNAKYFLGLTYSKLGQVPEAIQQFEALEVANPENLEVKAILVNLRSGKPPFPNSVTQTNGPGGAPTKLPVASQSKK